MKILLITSGANNDKCSSWLVFSNFVKLMRTEFNADIKIICLSPKFFNTKSELGETNYSLFLINGLLAVVFNRINKNYLWIISNFYTRIYSHKIYRYIKKNKINKLWIKADLIPMMFLDQILKKKYIPYHISVFDDPFFYQGYLPFIDKVNLKFKKLFTDAASIDTPTSFLYNYYKNNNIINNNTIVSESFVGVFKNSLKSPKINNKVRKIALTGSIYGIDAMIAFISAVSEILIKEKIEFHLITNTYGVYIKYLQLKYKNIFEYVKIMPFIPEHKLINELQNYDLLYLPMKFDEKYIFQTNSSFPSKTHNYLASQIPIIVHAPKNSSLYDFFESNNLGIIFDNLDKYDITSRFIKLLDKNTRLDLSNKIRLFNETSVSNYHVKKLYNIINS